MTESYKEHIITSTPSQIANGGKWLVKVIVEWDEGPSRTFQPFDVPLAGFNTKEIAESWGVAFGRKWIDDGKPNIKE